MNFEVIYEFIKHFGDEIRTLKINLINKKSLKSNHYWLMAVIPKLKNLKILKLYKDHDSSKFGEDGFKFLSKAFAYFQKNGGKLEKLEILRKIENQSGDYLYPCLKSLPDLQSLSFNYFDLSTINCKAIGKVLSDFKFIRELNLSNSSLGSA